MSEEFFKIKNTFAYPCKYTLKPKWNEFFKEICYLPNWLSRDRKSEQANHHRGIRENHLRHHPTSPPPIHTINHQDQYFH